MCNRRPSIHSRLVLKRSSKSLNPYRSFPPRECLGNSDGDRQELLEHFQFARDPNEYRSEAEERVAGLGDHQVSDPADPVQAAAAYLLVPTGVLVPEDSGHRVLKLPSINYPVDHSMISQKLAALESFRQFLSNGLFNDTWSRKTNQRSGFSNIDISKHGEACGNASGGLERIGDGAMDFIVLVPCYINFQVVA